MLGPKAYQGRPGAYVIAVLALVSIAVLFLADSASPGANLGALMVVPVLATAWLVEGRLALVVTLVAMASRPVEMAAGTVSPVTALAQLSVLPLVAGLSHLAAQGLLAERVAQRERREVRDLSFLVATSQEIAASLDLDRILAAATRATAQVVHRGGSGGQARAAFHQLVGSDRLRVALDYDEAGSRYGQGEYPVNWNKAAVRAIRRGRLETVREGDLAPDVQALAEREGWRAGALVPVNAGGRLVGLLVATARDHDRFSDEELHLVEVVAQMTGLAIGHAETLNREREEAERTAELERTKSELLRLASHELRGPLTVVRGYLSMILDGSVGKPDPGTSRMLRTVEAKVGEMEGLISQMLEAARLEDANLLLRMERFDLADAIAEAIERAATGEQAARVKYVRPPTELPVSADRSRVVTIVANLVGNALKYSPGGQDVTVTTAVEGGQVLTRVIDQGIGIAAKDLPRLFSRFGRVAPAEHAVIPGTGLGLYLSRELARLLAGDVTVESELGKGSTFTFTLPLAA